MNISSATNIGAHSYSTYCGYDDRYLHIHSRSKYILQKASSYSYDEENSLTAVREGKTLLMAATYDGDGNRVFQMHRIKVPVSSVSYAGSEIDIEPDRDAMVFFYDFVRSI